jgi:hypothetical protein
MLIYRVIQLPLRLRTEEGAWTLEETMGMLLLMRALIQDVHIGRRR